MICFASHLKCHLLNNNNMEPCRLEQVEINPEPASSHHAHLQIQHFEDGWGLHLRSEGNLRLSCFSGLP